MFLANVKKSSQIWLILTVGSIFLIFLLHQSKLEAYMCMYPEYETSSSNETNIPSIYEVTSYKNSYMTIINHKPSYRPGDTLHIHITVKDRNNQTLNTGGDIFSVRLCNHHQESYLPAKISDHNNGTYSVYLPLYWQGEMIIECKLLIPSAVADYLSIVQTRSDLMKSWTESIVYKSGDKSVMVNCSLEDIHGDVNEFCDLSPFNGYQTWFCPKHPDFPCVSDSIRKTIPPPPDYEKYSHLFNTSTWNVDKYMTQLRITVEGEDKFPETPAECPLGAPNVYPTGYFTAGKWHSNICSLRKIEDIDIKACLKNKSILLFGDSNAWRLRDVFVNIFQGNVHTFGDINYSPDFNTTIQYIKLGHGVLGWPQPGYKMQSVDEVLGHVNANISVIIISIWAHISFQSQTDVLNLLLTQRSHLLKWKAQNPRVEIFLRSPHYRNNGDPPVDLFNANNFFCHKVNELFNLVFRNTPFHIINIWDMVIAWGGDYHIHPSSEIMMESYRMIIHRLCL